MTEIKIEKKKPVWPWLLIGLGLVAALIYLPGLNDKREMKEAPVNAELISMNENNSTVVAFVNFVEADTNKMGLDHAYTNEALLKLIEATNAMAEEIGFEINADLDKAKEYANQITIDPFETTHALNIRNAADILSHELQNMQQAKYSGLTNEITELRNATAAISPSVLTLDQKEAVRSFFGKAADLLKKMN